MGRKASNLAATTVSDAVSGNGIRDNANKYYSGKSLCSINKMGSKKCILNGMCLACYLNVTSGVSLEALRKIQDISHET